MCQCAGIISDPDHSSGPFQRSLTLTTPCHPGVTTTRFAHIIHACDKYTITKSQNEILSILEDVNTYMCLIIRKNKYIYCI